MLVKKKYLIDRKTFCSVMREVASLLKHVFNDLTIRFLGNSTNCYIDCPSKHLMLHFFASKTKYYINIISDVPGYSNKNIELFNTENNLPIAHRIFNKIILLLNI